ncbi:lipocalin family protein [Fimbriiglobus ruber]|uniref:Lipocalin-like domain-containing protein n=1 Tax=Fimbriiglobus ruber TaxID=1908690 RepID=A0A225DFE0_9BACT|nr:lipocalin family protein [Fimbriiglobus ruber]OWK36066.1 hypothetical protein FRUB_08629 [Fimbriiglobus ruber]
MIRIAVVMSAFLGLVTATAALADDKSKNAEKLIGTWKLSKSDEQLPPDLDARISFEKEGKLKMSFSIKGKADKVDGTWKLDGETKLTVSFKEGEKEKTEVLTITKLTDDELVTVDDKKKSDEFKRVKEEKKEK